MSNEVFAGGADNKRCIARVGGAGGAQCPRRKWISLAGCLGIALVAGTGNAQQPISTAPVQASGWLLNQQALIQPGILPAHLERALTLSGSRMMTSDKALLAYGGAITDAQGTRSAQVTIQAPGYLMYKETQGHTVVFDGASLKSTPAASGAILTAGASTPFSSADEAIAESLLAHFPDMVCLQVATGGGYRKIATHVRTDNGKTPGYTGPYWTVLAFQPKSRAGLVSGAALQQNLFVAVDEQTGFVAEVRTVVNSAGKQEVTQTQFSNWTQQAGQSYPGKIVRLENGKQTLSFQVQSASVGAAGPTASFSLIP